MITCILGKPGAGKSYEAVRLACKAIEGGRHVLTNLPLHGEWWADARERGMLHEHDDVRLADGWLSSGEHWDELLTDKYKSGEGAGQKGALIIIDEVVRVFSPTRLRGPHEDVGKQRLYAAKLQSSCENTISTHRHARLDIVFLGQTYRQLPEWLRPQVEEWIELHSHKSSGMPGYSWRKYDSWYGMRTPLDQGVRRYDKEVFERYKSHALAEGVDEGDDQAHGFAVRKWWMRWQIWFAAIAVGGLIYALPQGYGILTSALRGEVGAETAAGLRGFGGGDSSAVGTVEPAAGESHVTSEEVATVIAAVAAARPSEAARSILEGADDLGGMPVRTVGFVGRVGEWYHYTDGSVLSSLDFVVRGYRIVAERPCLLAAEGDPGTMIVWRCPQPRLGITTDGATE